MSITQKGLMAATKTCFKDFPTLYCPCSLSFVCPTAASRLKSSHEEKNTIKRRRGGDHLLIFLFLSVLRYVCAPLSLPGGARKDESSTQPTHQTDPLHRLNNSKLCYTFIKTEIPCFHPERKIQCLATIV